MAEFVELVRQRNPVVASSLVDDHLARRLSVVVRENAGGYAGSLVLYEGDRLELERSMTGATCAEVADALAFITAMSAESTTDPQRADVPSTVPTSPAAAPIPSPLPPTAPGRWAVRLGALGEASTAISPPPVWGASLFLQAGPDHDVLNCFAYRLGFQRTLVAHVNNAVGGGDFRWTVGWLEISPVQLTIARSLRLRPAARAEGGALEATGNVASGVSRSETRGWAALAALARFDWAFGAPFSLEMALGISVPLTRDTFFFESDTKLYQPFPVNGWLEVGGSLRIW